MSKKALFAISSLWLWHATRSLPIIKMYLKKWYKIDIVSFWNALNYLKSELKEFEINFIEFIDYPELERWKWISFYFLLVLDLIKTDLMIKKENKFLEELQAKNNYSFIFSDWKYWFYSKNTKSYILSHQLSFEIPKIFSFSQKFMDYYNQKTFKKFDLLFIPDYEDSKNNLAWKLSHPNWIKKVNHNFVGILSSLNVGKILHPKSLSFKEKLQKEKIFDWFLPLQEWQEEKQELQNSLLLQKKEVRGEEFQKNEKIDYLFTISWYLLEHKENFINKLLEEAKELKWKKVFILWNTKKEEYYFDEKNNIEVFSFLSWEEKVKKFKNAEIIISRAGYTTIMDLVELQKKAILFPTPRQTEQEYLAKYLWNKKYFVYAKENEKLSDLVKRVENIKIFENKNKTKNALEKIYLEIN